jgi:hypothetical protein
MKNHSKIKLDHAMEVLLDVSKGLNANERILLESLILACNPTEEDGQLVIDANLFSTFCRNYIDAVTSNDPNLLFNAKGYKVKPVDVEEFLESEAYMNQKGHVRPVIKYELDRLFSNRDKFVEVVLSGGIGIGKSYFAEMAVAYMVYLNSCLINPQSEYDLAPGSSIYFILQSVSLTTARRVLFSQMLARMEQTIYFTKVFPFDKKVKSELRFPNHICITPISSSEMSAIGLNIFGGVLSEANFLQVVESSKQLKGNEAGGIFDQAERNYNTVMQRMRSRFDKMGKLPGMMILDSASHYPGDFLSRKIKEAETDPTIFVMKYAQWEALPKDRLSRETFLVEVGNEERESRILPKREMAHPDAEVIEVPMNYFRDFQRNCESALRDFAGITIGTEGAFIKDRAAVVEAANKHSLLFSDLQLFKKDEIIIDNELDLHMPRYDDLICHEYLDDVSFNKDAEFALHADLGLSKDAVGLVIGHIIDYVSLPSSTFYSDRIGEFVELQDLVAPVICLDGILRIIPPHGGEVSQELTRGLIIYLSQLVNLKFGTFDRYGSAIFIQGLRKLRVRSGLVSVVTTTVPYNELKAAYIERRIMHPRHAHYMDEIVGLQYLPKRNMIDHLPTKTKDIADAAAAVTHILTHKLAKIHQHSKKEQSDQRKTIINKRIRFRRK